MVDPAIAIALAGVVLAIALTLRYSRPVPGIRPSPAKRAGPDSGGAVSAPDRSDPPPAPAAGGHAHVRLASLLPTELTLFARVPRDPPTNAPDQAGPALPDPTRAELIVCDAMLRPVFQIVLRKSGSLPCPERSSDGATRLPVVAISPDADRAGIAALLAPAIGRMPSHRHET